MRMSSPRAMSKEDQVDASNDAMHARREEKLELLHAKHGHSEALFNRKAWMLFSFFSGAIYGYNVR